MWCKKGRQSTFWYKDRVPLNGEKSSTFLSNWEKFNSHIDYYPPQQKKQNAFNHESHLWLKIPMPFVLYYIIRILSGGAERLTASQIDKFIK